MSTGANPDWDKLIGEDTDEKEKRRRYLHRQVKQGKIPRFVFAKDRKGKLERYPDVLVKTGIDPLTKKTINYVRRGKLTWRTISIYEAIG